MFTLAVKFDVAQQHHLVVVFFKNRVVENFVQRLAISLGEKTHRARRAQRRFRQAFARHIFADFFQNAAIHFGHRFKASGTFTPCGLFQTGDGAFFVAVNAVVRESRFQNYATSAASTSK